MLNTFLALGVVILYLCIGAGLAIIADKLMFKDDGRPQREATMMLVSMLWPMFVITLVIVALPLTIINKWGRI
jgi:Ca2+/Na+ antiporter